jgi:hypothetical protein
MISERTIEFALGGFLLAGGSEPTIGKAIKDHPLPAIAVALGTAFLVHRAMRETSLSVGG